MVVLKNRQEIETMRISGDMLSKVHGALAPFVQPGIRTIELDKIAEKCIRDMGAEPSFKGYEGFPATLCISVNDEVVHTPPSNYQLKDGDIVSIDAGVCFKGFHSDSAFTYGVGNVRKELLNLLTVAEEALYKGIEEARVGNKIGDIGRAIQTYIERHKYGVVKGYTGHGIGRNLHEAPRVPNYIGPARNVPIQEGMTLAIEPMVNLGGPDVYMRDDWTVCTVDGKPSAHFEHSIAIVDGKPLLLTTFDYIKKTLKPE